MTRPLLLLAAVILCCCITTSHAACRSGCCCLRTTNFRVRAQVIEKIEVIPVSGRCRRTEIIITRKNGPKVCVNPKVMWIQDLLNEVQKRNEMSNSTTDYPPASTIDY